MLAIGRLLGIAVSLLWLGVSTMGIIGLLIVSRLSIALLGICLLSVGSLRRTVVDVSWLLAGVAVIIAPIGCAGSDKNRQEQASCACIACGVSDDGHAIHRGKLCYYEQYIFADDPL